MQLLDIQYVLLLVSTYVPLNVFVYFLPGIMFVIDMLLILILMLAWHNRFQQVLVVLVVVLLLMLICAYVTGYFFFETLQLVPLGSLLGGWIQRNRINSY